MKAARVRRCAPFRMADVETGTRRVREHIQHVILWLVPILLQPSRTHLSAPGPLLLDDTTVPLLSLLCCGSVVGV